MRIVLLGGATVLASCGGQNSAICERPADDKWNTLEACLHRAAYNLAPSQGSNSDIAKAAVSQCKSYVDGEADLDLQWSSSIAVERGQQVTTEQYLEARDEFKRIAKEEALEQALMRVVQGRAGNCDPID